MSFSGVTVQQRDEDDKVFRSKTTSPLKNTNIVISISFCCTAIAFIISVIWGLSDDQAGHSTTAVAAHDDSSSKAAWFASVLFVVVGCIFLSYNKHMEKHAIDILIPVEVATIFWYIVMERAKANTFDSESVLTKLVYMEFLCLWSTIGGTIVAEQVMGRYHVSLLAPVIMTVFTLALHSVSLPYLGANPSNLSFLPAVKVLFALQLTMAAVVYTVITIGMTPKSLDEILSQVHHTQTSITEHLHEIITTLGADGKTLHNHTIILDAHAEQLADVKHTVDSHTKILDTHTEQLDDLKKTVDSHTKILDTHTELLADMKQTLDNHAEQLACINKTLESKFDAVLAAVAKLSVPPSVPESTRIHEAAP